MTPPPPSWEEFASQLSTIVETEPAAIATGSRLVADLDLDSLALIELVVAMISEYNLSVPDGLDANRWKELTAGELFQAVVEGSLP